MRIELACATSAGALREVLRLPAGATVGEALAASRLVADAATADYAVVAIHGAVVGFDRTLEEGERIDLLPELPTSPMQARHRRAKSVHVRGDGSSRDRRRGTADDSRGRSNQT